MNKREFSWCWGFKQRRFVLFLCSIYFKQIVLNKWTTTALSIPSREQGKYVIEQEICDVVGTQYYTLGILVTISMSTYSTRAYDSRWTLWYLHALVFLPTHHLAILCLVVGQTSIIAYTAHFIKHHRNSMQNHSKPEGMEMVTSGSSMDFL